MSLTQLQQDLLNRIKDGKTVFSPDSKKVSIEQFQTVAEALIELYESGYIEMNKPHVESATGHRYIDLIFQCYVAE